GSDVSLTVEKASAVLARGRIIADDLEPPDTNLSNSTIGRMHHETIARRPFMDVAGNNLQGWPLVSTYRRSFGKPSTDEHVELFKRDWPARCVPSTLATPVARFCD